MEFKYRLEKIAHSPMEWEFFQSELERLSIETLMQKSDAVLFGGDDSDPDLPLSLFKAYRGRVTDLFSLCIPEELEKIGKMNAITHEEVVLNDVTAFIHLKGKRSLLLFQSMDKHTARTWMSGITGGVNVQSHDDSMVHDAMAESLNIATGRSLPNLALSFGPGDISIPFTIYSPGLILRSMNAPFVIERMAHDNTAITLGLLLIKSFEPGKK